MAAVINALQLSCMLSVIECGYQLVLNVTIGTDCL